MSVASVLVGARFNRQTGQWVNPAGETVATGHPPTLARDYTWERMEQWRKARRPEDARPVHPDALFMRNGYVVENTAGMCGCVNMTTEAGSKASWMSKKSGGSFRKNKYPGPCESCGCWVPAEAGVVMGHKNADGSIGWDVYC